MDSSDRRGCSGREGEAGLEEEEDAKTEREESLLCGCSGGDVHVSLIVS